MKLLRAGFEATVDPLFGWMYPREVEDRVKQQMLNIETAATHVTQEMRNGFWLAFGDREPWVCACVGNPEGQPLTVKLHPSFKAKCDVCGCSAHRGEVMTGDLDSVEVERLRRDEIPTFKKIEAKDFWRGPLGEPYRL